MSDENGNEIWQVEVSGQVYDASFTELADWIADGALQPNDKVRRGKLPWKEANRVQKLVAFFNAKADVTAPQSIVVSTTDGGLLNKAPGGTFQNEPAATSSTDRSTFQVNLPESAPQSESFGSSAKSTSTSDPDQCSNHSDRPGIYVCLSCSHLACRECVTSFGSSVMICSACGGMCKPKAELELANRTREFRNEAILRGFGIADFAKAVSHPFRFKTSLFFGALMFMFFSLGRGASSFGGTYMIVASLFSLLLANMLVFGILSNTVDNFAHGNFDANFMPDFEDFSVWDDVVHPFFLSIGVYISAFGPFIAVFLLGSYLVMSSVSTELDSMKANLEHTPGTPYYSARDTVDQSNDVQEVLNKTKEINQDRLDAQDHLDSGQQRPSINQEEENFDQINKMIADSKRKELESVVGKSAETREKETSAFFNGLLKLAAPIVVAGFIALLWGLFFFPAACTVAGYTKSFTATVNPLIGLDTIKRLGLDYIKILMMSLLLLIAFVFVSGIFTVVFAAFDMPGVGNLPAKALESVVWFYLTIVFACVLGFALFKASDRLRLYN